MATASQPNEEQAPEAATVAPAMTAETQDSTEETYAGDFWSRSTLTGDWGGLRDEWLEKGFTVRWDATYTYQRVTDGGLHGPLFHAFSDEDDNGNVFSGEIELELDTAAAGLWEGGSFNFQAEDRVGRSTLQRAGALSAVTNDALFPNIYDRFDREAPAVTNFSYEHDLGRGWSIYAGLLNNAEGDANEIAGSAVSNQHFLNSALLYSVVEDATTPNVSPGLGISWEPSERVCGSLAVYGTAETAGKGPFDEWNGTTFWTEWTFGHELAGRGGAQTFGGMYGMDASRTNIAVDGRTILEGVIEGQPVPETDSDTWAIYYNAHQYLQGDADGGWGLFARLGLSDGDPNPVRWNAAGGLGGVGLFPGRDLDRWGIGAFYLGMSDEDLLENRGIDDEVGGEMFYSIALAPWWHVTLDAQVIDSALPRGDTTWVLGVRTHLSF